MTTRIPTPFFARALPAFLLVCVSKLALAQAQPADVDVAAELETAARAILDGRPDDARTALDAVAAREPDNPWMWYYRGKARVQKGEPRAAVSDFDRALEALRGFDELDSPLAQSVQRSRREARRAYFDLSLQAGLAYDSNVTFGGEGATPAVITGREDGKFATRVEANYRPLVTPREELTLSARLAHAWHFAVEEYNDQDYGSTIRYAVRLGDRWRLDLLYDYDLLYLGNDPFLSNHGLSPRLTYQWDADGRAFELNQTVLDYRIDARDYLFHTDPRLDRDGFTNGVGLEQWFRFRPTKNLGWVWDVVGGYRFESVATEGREFDRWVHHLFAGVLVPLKSPFLPDRELTLRLDADVELSDYWHRSEFDRDKGERRDLIPSLGAVLSQQLVDDPKLGELILHAVIHWSDADSNVRAKDGSDPFTYDKLVAGVQFEWRF